MFDKKDVGQEKKTQVRRPKHQSIIEIGPGKNEICHCFVSHIFFKYLDITDLRASRNDDQLAVVQHCRQPELKNPSHIRNG